MRTFKIKSNVLLKNVYKLFSKVSFFWDPGQDMSSSSFPSKNRPLIVSSPERPANQTTVFWRETDLTLVKIFQYLTWFQPIWGIPRPSETIFILETFFKTVLIWCLKNWINDISINPCISLHMTRFWLMFEITLVRCTKAMSHKMFIIFTIFIFHSIRQSSTSSHGTSNGCQIIFKRWIYAFRMDWHRTFFKEKINFWDILFTYCWSVTCIEFWIASDDIFRIHYSIFKTFISIWKTLITIESIT